ncbi:MAG: hypothetical protein R6V06_09680 [Kiritimatiellia bacterium]
MTREANSGTTIVETVIAIVLLALVLAAAFPLVDQTLGRIYSTKDHYVATSICQARIERARQVPYSDLSLMDEKNILVDDFGNLAVLNGRFRRTTEVTTNGLPVGLTRMEVTTEICKCTRWGWMRFLHPINTENRKCGFDGIQEKMSFLFTEYEER